MMKERSTRSDNGNCRHQQNVVLFFLLQSLVLLLITFPIEAFSSIQSRRSSTRILSSKLSSTSTSSSSSSFIPDPLVTPAASNPFPSSAYLSSLSTASASSSPFLSTAAAGESLLSPSLQSENEETLASILAVVNTAAASAPTTTIVSTDHHETSSTRGDTTTTTDSDVVVEEMNVIKYMESSTTQEKPKVKVVQQPKTWKHRFMRALPLQKGRVAEHMISDQERDHVIEDGWALDKKILKTAIPSMINLAVVPIVNSVDTFWVGRMGNALALAGQAAANQAFFTLFFLVNYLPTITAPMVASAVASKKQDQAQQRVCESLFLSNLFGLMGTIFLVAAPRTGLGLILPPGQGGAALEYAAPYLRFRALSMVPALMSATGFAAFRGMLDTVTPLKVSLFTNLLNLLLDPLLIFASPLGFVGAAVATAVSETVSGLIYLRLLFKRKLAKVSLLLFQPPSLKSLVPLLQGGVSMLGRQIALNVGLVTMARRVQAMDPTGVSAAAHGIVMQLYAIGIVIHVAIQGTAAALVPSTLASAQASMTATDNDSDESTEVSEQVEEASKNVARRVADRIFAWGAITGVVLGVGQVLALPWIVPLFSTLPQVQEAVKVPALMVALLHVINGFVFAGEGTMLGLGCFRDLMLLTAGGIATLVGSIMLTPMGKSLEGIMASNILFCALQAVAVVTHYLKFGPLAVKKKKTRTV